MLKLYTNKVLDFIIISFMSAVLVFFALLYIKTIFGLFTESYVKIISPSPVISIISFAITSYGLYFFCKWIYKIIKTDTRVWIHLLLSIIPFILFIVLLFQFYFLVDLTDWTFGFKYESMLDYVYAIQMILKSIIC